MTALVNGVQCSLTDTSWGDSAHETQPSFSGPLSPVKLCSVLHFQPLARRRGMEDRFQVYTVRKRADSSSRKKVNGKIRLLGEYGHLG